MPALLPSAVGRFSRNIFWFFELESLLGRFGSRVPGLVSDLRRRESINLYIVGEALPNDRKDGVRDTQV